MNTVGEGVQSQVNNSSLLNFNPGGRNHTHLGGRGVQLYTGNLPPHVRKPGGHGVQLYPTLLRYT